MILTTLVLVLTPVVIAQTTTTIPQLIASVDIPESCGIVIDPTTINFDQVYTGGISPERTTDVTNQGSVAAVVDIQGTDWLASPEHFDVGNTVFGTATNPTTQLSLVEQLFANIDHGNTQTAYFKMSVPTGQAMGVYTQTITFTAECMPT